jgi:non-haem Fe2+, alpha-ketoglutarate-dependent halogenase
MPLRLTSRQIEQYQREGFVHPIRVMAEDEAVALRRHIEAFESAQGRPLHGTQITKCALRFPPVYDLARSAEVLDAVEDLIGPDILMYQNGAWFKEPDSGAYVSWHQDSTYYGMDPLDLVTCWVALSPTTLETGCMQVMPGSHKSGQLPVDYSQVNPDNLLSSGQNTRYPTDEARSVAMELWPGEMSMHHVCVVHSSRPNRGVDRRCGFSIAYMGPHVRQTTRQRASAMLMRGTDRFGHYPLDERPPLAASDPATIERHEHAVALYRAKAKECGNRTVWRHG